MSGACRGQPSRQPLVVTIFIAFIFTLVLTLALILTLSQLTLILIPALPYPTLP